MPNPEEPSYGEATAEHKGPEQDETATALNKARADFARQIDVACRGVLLEATLRVVMQLEHRLKSLAKGFDEDNFILIIGQLEQLQATFKFILGKALDATKRLVEEPRGDLLGKERAALERLSLYELQEIFTERKKLVHDANNMLTVIWNLLVLAKIDIEKGEIGKGEKRLNEVLATPLARMIELLNSGVNKPPFVPMNMGGLRKRAASLAAELPDDMELTVEDQITEGIETDLGITETHFAQLLFNLAHNAYQAGARKVKLVFRVQADKLIILVQDDGPGFGGRSPLEASAESNVVNAKGDGTRGNGLVFCTDFCRKAGGDLKLLSTHRDEERQIGAEFEASFPLKREAVRR